jgi:predicted dehydrogenase
MKYSPAPKPGPVVQPGEFIFAASHLDHGHIYGQCGGLIEAGGDLRYVYDPDPKRLADFVKKFPQAKPVDSYDRLLDNSEIRLIATAAIPCERGPLGCLAMRAGKDYFTDKAPFTTLEQLAEARNVAAEIGRKYAVYYSERLHSEAAIFAGQLIERGAVGRVVQVVGFGPHRCNPTSRPAWFFERAKYGGILTDIGSHQVEQFLTYTGAKGGRVSHAAIANYHYKDHPELEDFGEASFILDNGTSAYCRIDWLTPTGLGTWGDGRTIILGTTGYLELRKVIDIGREKTGNHVYLVNDEVQEHYEVGGQVGFPYFGQLILDCLNRTENAMTQAHAFLAAELSMQAQAAAVKLE